MTETRKIIGVIDAVPKVDFAFPSVRVWIDGPVGHQTHDLKQSFPDRGTVYLHVTACEGQHLVPNQVGLFTCVPSLGEKAEWKVRNTSRHLAQIIVCPTWEQNKQHLAFWEWLTTHKDNAACNILLGGGAVFIRRGKSELVGPFQFTPEGGIAARKQIQCFRGIETLKLDVSGRPCEFIDTEVLTQGQPLIVDPREAIHRRLKLVHDTSHLEWLSRTKLQELSTALAGIAVSDGSEWVMENLPRALEAISASGNLDGKLLEAILQIKALADAIEAAWKKKHIEDVKKAEEEIERLGNKAAGIQNALAGLNGDLARLQSERKSLEGELQELNRKIEAAKAEAQEVFNAELKRLAASPESLALFAAWSCSGNRGTETDSAPRIKIQQWDTERQKSPNLFDALTNNLKGSGLSVVSAPEVATVCGAALLAGQPVSFRSIFSELIADAVVSALGQPMAVWADVPAGLLDPIDWNSLLTDGQQASPIILQGANRSDFSLVLGSKRLAVLRQALGYQKQDALLFMTLEPSEGMHVQPDFNLGPLIDDRMLKFASAKAASAIFAFAVHSTSFAGIAMLTDDEFLEVVGIDFARLPLFTTSAQRVVYRRAIAGLKLATNNSEEVSRLFFKYWVLPRLTSSDVIRVLDTHKEKWKQDTTLNELAQTLTSNE